MGENQSLLCLWVLWVFLCVLLFLVSPFSLGGGGPEKTKGSPHMKVVSHLYKQRVLAYRLVWYVT